MEYLFIYLVGMLGIFSLPRGGDINYFVIFLWPLYLLLVFIFFVFYIGRGFVRWFKVRGG